MKGKDKLWGFGINQRRILHRMAKEGLVMRIVMDDSNNTIKRFLCDEQGDNHYEIIPEGLFNSLIGRPLFNMTPFRASVDVTIHTFSLKEDQINRFKNMQPEALNNTP